LPNGNYGTLCLTLHIYQAISYDAIFASSLYVCQAKIAMRIIPAKNQKKNGSELIMSNHNTNWQLLTNCLFFKTLITTSSEGVQQVSTSTFQSRHSVPIQFAIDTKCITSIIFYLEG